MEQQQVDLWQSILSWTQPAEATLLEELKIRGVCRQLRHRDTVQRYAVIGIDGNYRTRAAVGSLAEHLCDAMAKPSEVIVVGGLPTAGRSLMIGSGPLPAPPENEQESWRLIHSHQGVFGWEPVASETLIGLRRPAATDRPSQYDSPSPQQ